ncbi:Kynurenine--oxoglutarate transaminase 3 [Trichinella sp. T8]|nr:Kynurenine--oxoglutarate transaminase 3 [Trichinella sp. T8]
MNSLICFHIKIRTPLSKKFVSMKNFVTCADRVKGTKPSIWVEMSALVNKYDAVNLGQGFTDFRPPAYFTDQLSKAAQSTDYKLNQYTRGYGHLPLVEVIGKFYASLLDHPVNPLNEILITNGAYQALFYAAFAFINHGDEAIIIEPYYDCYEPQVRMAGGKPIFTSLKLEKKKVAAGSSGDFKLDFSELENKVTPRTKLLYLNNPLNPIGKVYNRDELMQIAAFVKKHNLIVVADEVYEWLVYEGSEMIRFASLPDMWERTITIGSAGKTFSLTGWKMGWAICSENLMVHLRSVHQNCVYTCATPIQCAMADSFQYEIDRFQTRECYFHEMRRILQSKRRVLQEMLSENGFMPVLPEGGYFMVANFSALSDLFPQNDNEPLDYQFTRWLCSEKKLGVIPMTAFYSDENKHFGENYVRFCFFKMSSEGKNNSSSGADADTDLETLKDFLRQYSRISEQCFVDCVHDFTTRSVTVREENCVSNCLEKYLKVLQRISQRFHEYQLIQAEATGNVPLRNK